MSGEFGHYNYTGYIDQVIRQIADECIFGDEACYEENSKDCVPMYKATRLVGFWLANYLVPIVHDITYNEACDSHPGQGDIDNVNLAIEGLIKLRDEMITAGAQSAQDGGE
jgi:hypothetical protein